MEDVFNRKSNISSAERLLIPNPQGDMLDRCTRRKDCYSDLVIRASASQSEGRKFEPCVSPLDRRLHQENKLMHG